MEKINDKIKKAAKILFQKKNTSVLTGAGISVDSGIPDFRSAGGIWDRFDPNEYAHISSFKSNPKKMWVFFNTINEEFGDAKPNAGHYALAEMEKVGIVESITTQNIDFLHQKAGSKNVIDIHGNNNFLVCIYCGKKYENDKPAKIEDKIPYCECGRILKPDVVMFGEILPQESLLKAQKSAAESSVYIVAGTSAVVMPANMLPQIAKRTGSTIIEINLEETGLTGSITDIFLKGSTTDILPALVNELKQNK